MGKLQAFNYAVLRIIRELTVNGMRHGHATEVAIALRKHLLKF